LNERKSDYFVADGSTIYRYKINRPDLKDTPGVRRKLVNLLNPSSRKGKINFNEYRVLQKHGYCFSPKNNPVLAMDFITDNGFITAVVVGSLPACQGDKINRDQKRNDFTPLSSEKKAGSGC